MLNINIWNIVFTVINVLVLYALMKKFLVKPVMGIIEKREQLIQGKLKEAEKSKKQALELKEQYEEKIAAASKEAGQFVELARKQAQELQETMLAETEQQTEKLVNQARKEIAGEQERARREAEGQIAELAMLAARRILKTGEVHDTNSY